MVKSGEAKDELIESYKENLHNIPCKHFNKGRGECPFLNSCNYAHILPSGEHYEYPWLDDRRFTTDGEWIMDDEPTLAERMGMI
jgi:hypothetical protein